jgi:hypothetical protein
MDNAIALLAVALLANKIIELLKDMRAGNWNGALTLLSLFVAGVAALTLAAHAMVTETMTIPGVEKQLGQLDFASLVLLGLMITSTGSTVYDFKKAFDQTDSARQPPLTTLPNGDPPTPA